jgi:hypothetical protein
LVFIYPSFLDVKNYEKPPPFAMKQRLKEMHCCHEMINLKQTRKSPEKRRRKKKIAWTERTEVHSDGRVPLLLSGVGV